MSKVLLSRRIHFICGNKLIPAFAGPRQRPPKAGINLVFQVFFTTMFRPSVFKQHLTSVSDVYSALETMSEYLLKIWNLSTWGCLMEVECK